MISKRPASPRQNHRQIFPQGQQTEAGNQKGSKWKLNLVMCKSLPCGTGSEVMKGPQKAEKAWHPEVGSKPKRDLVKVLPPL